MKFTFKTEKPTGRYRSFDVDTHHIKLKKKKVGYINDKFRSEDGKFSISLAVSKAITPESSAPFKWIKLKKEFDTLDEAKIFLNEPVNFKFLTKHIKLYQFEG